MKTRKRRIPEPLNFIPEEKIGRDMSRVRAASEPRPLRTPATAEKAKASMEDAPFNATPDLGLARHAYLAASLATAAWGGMLAAYTLGYVGGWTALTRAPAELAITVLLAVFPGVFIFAAAFTVRQGARLAAEVRLAHSLSNALITPAAVAAARTHDIIGSMRHEVERAASATLSVHGQLVSVREGLAAENDRLTATAADAQRTARVVGETLTRERDAVAALLADLKAGALNLSESVDRQGRLVADASDLARSQLQEAEATLAAGAAGLASAGADVGAAAERAGETLMRQAERLDTAAAALSERLRFLDARLTEQRSGLSAIVQGLAADEEDMALRLEDRRAQLSEALAQSRAGTEQLDQAVEDGAAALRSLAQSAADQVRDLSDVTRAGRAALAADARDAQSQAEAYVATARAQIEHLGQAAFDTGQRANHAFDTRVGEARRMIEQAASLVEEAGQRSATRIAEGVAVSRGVVETLSAAVGEVDARVARLPESAGRQIADIRAVVEHGLTELTAAAHRAAAETQAIDQAFQDRIKRNYETLSEAVKLMGRVAGAVDPSRQTAHVEAVTPPPPAPAPAPKPIIREPDFASVKWSAPVVVTASDAAFQPQRPPASSPGVATQAEPAPPVVAEVGSPSPPPAEAWNDADPAPGLRPRLKFTPTPADTALKAVFEPSPRGERPPRSGEGGSAPVGEPDAWTWKDLLSSMDDAPTDLQGLAEQMVRQIDELGVDAPTLLPPARVEELARVQLAGDPAAARDTLRRLAPAAIRRLSRRVLSDRDLREQADRFVARYQDLLRDAAQQEGGLRTAVTLLACEAGRAFLLMDAAVGEL